MATKDGMARNRGIDDVLNETELGSWIANNKFIVTTLLVIVVGGVVGYGVKRKVDHKNHIEKSAIIFEFNQNHMKKVTSIESSEKADENKIDENFVSELKSVIEKIDGYEGGNILVLSAVDLLLKNKMYQGVVDVLTLSKDKGLAKNPYVNYLFTTRMAVAQEDLGQKEAAVQTLETLLNSPVKILQGKLYLDLGRLYKNLGDNAKAKSNLEYVVQNSKQADFLKMARLYLTEID